MTIFDFRKHKSCLYLPWLAIHSISFTAIRLAQTLQIQGRVDCLILLISAKITSDNTSRPVFADIYSLIFCSKTAPRFIHLIHFNNYFQPEGSEDIHKINHIANLLHVVIVKIFLPIRDAASYTC